MNSIASHLLEHLQTGVVFADGELRLRYINPAAEALLEASSSRVLGEPVASVFADLDEGTAVICQARAAGQTLTKRHAVLKLATGTAIDADYSVTPVDAGVLIEVQAIDRLLRINRDTNVHQSLAAARQLVRGLAHEVKNPLTALRMTAELLRERLPDHPRHARRAAHRRHSHLDSRP